MSALCSKIDITQELHRNRRRYLTLIDLDCFYAQVEAKRYNIDASIPLAVQQWGAVIAVNYKSREFGVKRGDTLTEIKKKCPKIILCHVDVVNENGEIIPGKFNKFYHENYKVTLELYREENFKILDIFRQFTPNVERASIDEAYIDLTDIVNQKYDTEYTNTNHNAVDLSDGWEGNVIGGVFNPRNEEDIKLMICSQIVHKIRMSVVDQLGYTCSGGVAHNKKFAKMISSMNKPNGQTILPSCGLTQLLSTTSFTKVQGFGGKLGQKLMDTFQVNTFHDITSKVGVDKLMHVVDESAALWIWRICHGIDEEPVKIVGNVKRIGSSKNLRGVYTNEQVRKHLKICASELLVRIRNDRKRFKRVPKTMVVSYRTRAHGFKSITTMMTHLPADDILIKQHLKYSQMLTDHAAKSLPNESGMEYLNIGLSVSGFVDLPKHNIVAMWSNKAKQMNSNNSNSNTRYNVSLCDEDVVKKTKKKKSESNGIERFLTKDKGNDMVNSNHGKSKKRKRKGALLQYLTDKTDKVRQPPLKKRKVSKDREIVCEKCRDVICREDNNNKDMMIQTHMDSHLANELSKQWNDVPQPIRVQKNTKKTKKKKKGIMNYFQLTK
eukprot:143489_1